MTPEARPAPILHAIVKEGNWKELLFLCWTGKAFPESLRETPHCHLHYRKITARLPEVYDFPSVTTLFSFPLDERMTSRLLVKAVSGRGYGTDGKLP